MSATDAEIVQRVNEILMDFTANKLGEIETIVMIGRASMLRDVSRGES